jgi:hypothetical protein
MLHEMYNTLYLNYLMFNVFKEVLNESIIKASDR